VEAVRTLAVVVAVVDRVARLETLLVEITATLETLLVDRAARLDRLLVVACAPPPPRRFEINPAMRAQRQNKFEREHEGAARVAMLNHVST
jgi:hypothetical protein